MSILITTTVTLPGGILVIPEFGGRTFTHPITNYDLETEFDIDEIRQSVTLGNALTNGYITLTDGNSNPITDLIELQVLEDSVIDISLIGYTSGAGTISAGDSILSAIQKLNGNIGALVTGVSSVNSLTGAVALTGTSDRITISGANVFDIASTYIGQTSITTLGTITTGVWNGTTIAIANGGTSATTANDAINNLLPSQAGNNAKVLSTDGLNSSWVTVAVAGVNGGTVTSVDGSGGTTGLTLTGGPITVNGTLTLGGTLAITNGGTGQITSLSSFNALSPLTTKGDLLTRDTTNNVRVPVGTDGQVLIADSAQASGVKWGVASDISGQAIKFLSSNTANSETVVNTTEETNFTSNQTNCTIPAGIINAGNTLRFIACGKFSTKTGTVGTLSIRLKIGTLVINTNIVTLGSNTAAVDSGFQFIGQVQFRTNGVTGSAYSNLLCAFDVAGAGGTAATFVNSSNGTNLIDTTINNTIQMSAQWATANENNSITLEQVTFEILN